ncbi:hypothetical protein BH11CYA1_BH11CYA1_02680 [soil metagenome]
MVLLLTTEPFKTDELKLEGSTELRTKRDGATGGAVFSAEAARTQLANERGSKLKVISARTLAVIMTIHSQIS